MEKLHFLKKTKDKNGHAISLPDAIKMTKNTSTPKTLLTHLNTHHICPPHQVWSHSAHKRPRNYQKNVFFHVFGYQNAILTMFLHPKWPQKNVTSTFSPEMPLTHLNIPPAGARYQISTDFAHKRLKIYQKTYFVLFAVFSLTAKHSSSDFHARGPWAATKHRMEYLTIREVA